MLRPQPGWRASVVRVVLAHERLPGLTLRSIRASSSVLRHRPDIRRARPDQAPRPLLLLCMRGPPGHTRDCEDWREGLTWNGERIKQDRGKELDIGLERPV